jgi:hypothetical protein
MLSPMYQESHLPEMSEKVSLCGQAFYTLFPLEKQGRQHPCPDTLFRTLLEACYAYGCD